MDKKEKSALLFSAIGEIDDDLIKEASAPARRSSSVYKTPLAVCAAVFLIMIFFSGAVKLFMPSGSDGNANLGGDNMSNAPDLPLGDSTAGGSQNSSQGNSAAILYTDGASLKLLQKSDSVYTFKLIITKEQDSIDVIIRGSGKDEAGEPIFVISTTADYAELTHIPLSPPKIKIDGEDVTKITTAIGEYTLTVDLSSLEKGFVWEEMFTISPFGEIKR